MINKIKRYSMQEKDDERFSKEKNEKTITIFSNIIIEQFVFSIPSTYKCVG